MLALPPHHSARDVTTVLIIIPQGLHDRGSSTNPWSPSPCLSSCCPCHQRRPTARLLLRLSSPCVTRSHFNLCKPGRSSLPAISIQSHLHILVWSQYHPFIPVLPFIHQTFSVRGSWLKKIKFKVTKGFGIYISSGGINLTWACYWSGQGIPVWCVNTVLVYKFWRTIKKTIIKIIKKTIKQTIDSDFRLCVWCLEKVIEAHKRSQINFDFRGIFLYLKSEFLFADWDC